MLVEFTITNDNRTYRSAISKMAWRKLADVLYILRRTRRKPGVKPAHSNNAF